MRSMRLRALALPMVVPLAFAPGPVPASAQPAATRADRLAAALEEFEIGDPIRVAFERQNRLHGRLLAVGRDSLELSVDGVPAGVALGEIDGVWSRGNAVGKGALIGGLAGFALGATYGLLIGEIACAETSCTRLEVGAVGGLVVGAAGAGTGALIGLAIPVWKPRFP